MGFQEVRELNHEQEAKDRNRRDAVYAVVVVSLSKSSPYLQEVDGRTDAYVFKPQDLERPCLWENIVRAYKLQGSRVRDLVDTPEAQQPAGLVGCTRAQPLLYDAQAVVRL